MKKISLIVTFVAVFTFLAGGVMFAGGPLDPIRVDRWVVNAGIGPGTHYFGNGAGFGPALKGSFEKGMWDVGPGVVTLGGEMTFSFFSQNFGAGWHESWFNVLLGARGAYHYGWNVEGLDTYGGLPLGLGFCAHSFDDHPGSAGSTPVYPYAGIFFGASYFFTKNLGVNGEVGFNSTYANIGMVYRIK
ncbi:MAG TPA: hypothetical protein PLK82_02245 [Bacteroidales bacterium]|nr:hypothetical protein [Bacteroidales bacterium]